MLLNLLQKVKKRYKFTNFYKEMSFILQKFIMSYKSCKNSPSKS